MSMSWTDEPCTALDYASHSKASQPYRDLLGQSRLPLWTCTFPATSVLAILHHLTQREFVIDIERYPPDEAVQIEPTTEQLAAYCDFLLRVL